MRRALRLVHVTPFYEPDWAFGGMARAPAGLCRALARGGHEVTVVTARVDGRQPDEERLGGVRVLRLDSPRALVRWLVPWAPRLAALLRHEARTADVAHVHGHRSGFALTAGAVMRRARIPYVLTTHGTFPDHGRHRVAKRILDLCAGRRLLHGAAAVVAVSEAEARDLPRSAVVVPNGVEAPGGAPGASRPGAWLLFVGNDSPQKRGDRLRDLLAALPRVQLDLVGPFGEAFRRRFHDLDERVCWRGVLGGDALAAAYASANLLVHPAVGEAFGLSPFEAALLGTGAVVAGGHGCGEWFRRAGGCVVPPDDGVALAEAVSERLERRAIAEAEAHAVAGFARSQLTWEKAAAAHEALYATLADRRGGETAPL
ncbi:MAG: glycosyltransferase [Acidobacteria bacterium]|nr:glycosyltransferase [Acidobacteriota bacterium]